MKKIYLNEYNLPMDNAIYFPYASGLLRAYAESFKAIKDKYQFMPFIFKRDSVDNIVAQHKDPHMACFSVSIWNYALSLAVATKLKELYPTCIIVFGGPSTPKEPQKPIDYCIHGQGEDKFVSLLLDHNIKLIDINEIPSPYLTGLFDYLLNEDVQYQAIIETNRGCPFKCAYCYWGSGSKKYQMFDIDRIDKEAEWMGKNKISYVFCADSNFGSVHRDTQVASTYAIVKDKTGYPEKFRVCYGKTNMENIFKSAQILHKSDLAKAVTLSMQSMEPRVIKYIHRTNMKLSEFESMQKKYADENIPTYTELILGLPGETHRSFVDGVKEVLKYNNNIFIYHCSILPNTLMADKNYQKKYKIKTVKVPMSEVHCKVRADNEVKEYDEIIISTKTMTDSEWVDLTAWSWEIQLHNLGVKIVPFNERLRFIGIARGMTLGKPRCQVVPGSDIYWEPEEAAFLRIYSHIPNIEKKLLYNRKGNLHAILES